MIEYPIDYSKVSNIQFEDIDYNDYPDFSNAFIVSADYDGESMSEEMLDILNDDRGFVYEKLIEYLY